MATCVRGGFRYKRHKVENGVCKHCGGVVVSAEQRKAIIDATVAKMKEVNG